MTKNNPKYKNCCLFLRPVRVQVEIVNNSVFLLPATTCINKSGETELLCHVERMMAQLISRKT
jgi:hypothetical protein